MFIYLIAFIVYKVSNQFLSYTRNHRSAQGHEDETSVLFYDGTKTSLAIKVPLHAINSPTNVPNIPDMRVCNHLQSYINQINHYVYTGRNLKLICITIAYIDRQMTELCDDDYTDINMAIQLPLQKFNIVGVGALCIRRTRTRTRTCAAHVHRFFSHFFSIFFSQ